MSTSAVPYLIDYLVATSKANVNLGARAVNPVTIQDSVSAVDDWPQFQLWIGVDDQWLLNPTANPFVTSATTTQQWIGIGARHREEIVTLKCAADSWSGDGETAASLARLQAYGIMSAFEDMTRNDANAGGNVLFTDPGVTNTSLYQGQINVGSRAIVGFDFVCLARIGA
jgi:hypothetical protein